MYLHNGRPPQADTAYRGHPCVFPIGNKALCTDPNHPPAPFRPHLHDSPFLLANHSASKSPPPPESPHFHRKGQRDAFLRVSALSRIWGRRSEGILHASHLGREHDDFHHSFDKVILRMYSHKPTTHIAHGQRCSARRCAREGKATMHIAYILAMYYPDHHRDQRRCPCAPLSSKGFQVLNAQRPNPFPEHDSGESGGSSGAQRKDRSGPSATIQAPTYSVL